MKPAKTNNPISNIDSSIDFTSTPESPVSSASVEADSADLDEYDSLFKDL
jgi:hypothetical protein